MSLACWKTTGASFGIVIATSEVVDSQLTGNKPVTGTTHPLSPRGASAPHLSGTEALINPMEAGGVSPALARIPSHQANRTCHVSITFGSRCPGGFGDLFLPEQCRSSGLKGAKNLYTCRRRLLSWSNGYRLLRQS